MDCAWRTCGDPASSGLSTDVPHASHLLVLPYTKAHAFLVHLLHASAVYRHWKSYMVNRPTATGMHENSKVKQESGQLQQPNESILLKDAIRCA